VETTPVHLLTRWLSCCRTRDCWDDCTVGTTEPTYQ